MNISRIYLIIGSLYLLVGILFGMYMGGSGDHTFAPLHAHINLLGFTLMTVFGLVFLRFPAMAGHMLAKLQFWFHQIGALILLVLLYLLFSGTITEAAMFPLAPISELLVLIAFICFAVNLYRNGR